ncbi:MAG: hypothetical protein LBU36_00935 [Clostridiales bacterium]|jgi:hypothetical protein|nr:hypothetical protein [Clostridiales bacterium]
MRVQSRKHICRNYKSHDLSAAPGAGASPPGGCRRCVYFASENCRAEAADTIEPWADLFY